MLTSIRGLMAATMFAGTLFAAAPAMAQEEESGISVTGNVALATDYRFRGYSLTDGDIALQGGIDVALPAGFYVGTWASNITGGTPYGDLELDVYGGWAGDVGGVGVNVGALYYIYPTGDFGGTPADFDTDFIETFAKFSADVGPVTPSIGFYYTPEQNSTGDEDNIYISAGLAAGIPNTPVSVSANVGYNDGPFSFSSADDTVWDWNVGASYAISEALSLSATYTSVGGAKVEDFSDDGLYFTIKYAM